MKYETHNEEGMLTREEWLIGKNIRHRLNGPAIITHAYDMNNKSYISAEGWFINNQLHRADGPATTIWIKSRTTSMQDCYKQWFIFGREYSETEYNNIKIWADQQGMFLPYTEEDLMAIKLRWS